MTTRPASGPEGPGGGGVRAGLAETAAGCRRALADRTLLAGLIAVFLVPVAVTAGVGLALSRADGTVPLLARIVDPPALLLWPPTFAVAVGAGLRLVAGHETSPADLGASLRAATAATARRWRPLLGWGVLSVAGVLAAGGLALQVVERPAFDPAHPQVQLWAVVAGVYAWSVLTFFVVPVIVFEERGLGASLRRALALLARGAGAAATVQTLFTAGLVALAFAGFTGGALAFVGAGISIFALPLGLLFASVGLAMVAASVALVGLSFAAHCGVRYRLYERVR